MTTILLVEQDNDLRRVVAANLEQQGWRVLTASAPSDARQFLGQEEPTVLVFGTETSWQAGGKLIDQFRDHADDGDGESLVVITPTDRLAEQWRRTYEPDVVIYKPYDIRYLNRKLTKLLRAPGSSIAG
jgi:DNA-binding response OmpR family regulator